MSPTSRTQATPVGREQRRALRRVAGRLPGRARPAPAAAVAVGISRSGAASLGPRLTAGLSRQTAASTVRPSFWSTECGIVRLASARARRRARGAQPGCASRGLRHRAIAGPSGPARRASGGAAGAALRGRRPPVARVAAVVAGRSAVAAASGRVARRRSPSVPGSRRAVARPGDSGARNRARGAPRPRCGTWPQSPPAAPAPYDAGQVAAEVAANDPLRAAKAQPTRLQSS